MTVGFSVWLLSLAMTLRIGRATAEQDWRTFDDISEPGSAVETGARTVRGEPRAISKALARSLTQLNIGGFNSLFEIVERSDRRILVKKTGPLICNQPAGMYFSEAEIGFEDMRNDTVRVSYCLRYDRLAKRLKSIALIIILLVALPMMVIVGGIIWYVVIPSPNPGVRWQVFQTFQIVHALWPPYLLIWLYSAGRRQSKTYMSNLLSTLELAEQT
jgi:hypothetical protein